MDVLEMQWTEDLSTSDVLLQFGTCHVPLLFLFFILILFGGG